ASHSWVRLKSRMRGSAAYAGRAMAVVYANGSGTGRARFSMMYWPVRKCHQKSGSAISVENSPNRRIVESNRSRARGGMSESAGELAAAQNPRSTGVRRVRAVHRVRGRAPRGWRHGWFLSSPQRRGCVRLIREVGAGDADGSETEAAAGAVTAPESHRERAS